MTVKTDRRTLLGTSAAALALGMSPGAKADETKASVAPSAPPPIEAFAQSAAIDQIAISPDGKRVAVVSQVGDEKKLIYFDSLKGDSKAIGLGPAKIRNLLWADNNHIVLVDATVTYLPQFAGDKHEFRLARVLKLDPFALTTLFNREDGFYSIIMGDLHRIKVNGEYRITASNYRMENGYNLCLFSFGLDQQRGHLIYEASNDTEGFVVTPEGHPLAYSDFNDERKIWSLYINQSEPGKSSNFKSVYTVKDPLNTPSLEGLGRDGKSVVLYMNKGEAKGEYHEVSMDGVLSAPLDSSDDPRSYAALFHPTTWRFAGFKRDDDWFEYDYSDPLLKKLADALPQVMGEEYRTAIMDFAEDPRKLVLYGESPKDAGSYYFYDFSTGDMTTIGANYPDIPEEWITEKQAISYKAADGTEIHGYLTLPPYKDAKNLPLIVLPHGGPWARDTIAFDWQSQVLASRGYAVLQPNFRGSTGYGSAFTDAGQGEMGKKMQTDLSDGVRYLVSKGTVDAKRVAILGASYGGYAALAGATLDPGIYNCAVSIAGLSDLKAWVDHLVDNYVTRDSSHVLGWTDFLGDKKNWDAVSPAKQAAKASCPILLVHGTDDTVVPIDQSQRMEKALKMAGKYVEFVTYKGQDHWETVGSARIEMMKTALIFLAKYNPA